MATETGTVTNVNDTGIKLDSWAGWANYSKAEFRDEQFDIPQKGDQVEVLRVSEGKFIKSIKVVGKGSPQVASGGGPSAPSASMAAEDWARKWALEQSCLYWQGRDGTHDDVVVTAEAFADFLGGSR